MSAGHASIAYDRKQASKEVIRMQKLQTIAAFLALAISIVALVVSCQSDQKVRQCEFLYSSNGKLIELQEQIELIAKSDNYGDFSEVQLLMSASGNTRTPQEEERAMNMIAELAGERSDSLAGIRDLLTRYQYAFSDHILESVKEAANTLQGLAVRLRTDEHHRYNTLVTSYQTADSAILSLSRAIEEEHRGIAQRLRTECAN